MLTLTAKGIYMGLLGLLCDDWPVQNYVQYKYYMKLLSAYTYLLVIAVMFYAYFITKRKNRKMII